MQMAGSNVERIREVLLGSPTPDYFAQKVAQGWKPVAVEWEREEGAERHPAVLREDIPFGLRVGNDCLRLEENPSEVEVLYNLMELIVQDTHLIRVAEELNAKGYRNRNGAKWTAASVFGLLPRLVEVGPQIFTSEEWVARRQRLFYVV
jgi:hypothetical protein